MKRMWLGIGILAVLLALGIGITVAMEGRFAPISEKMSQAAAAARMEDGEGTWEAFNQAEGLWNECRHFAAAVADHEPMEEIDGLFAAARVHGECADWVHCASLCAQLAELTHAMGEAHWLTWWTFL